MPPWFAKVGKGRMKRGSSLRLLVPAAFVLMLVGTIVIALVAYPPSTAARLPIGDNPCEFASPANPISPVTAIADSSDPFAGPGPHTFIASSRDIGETGLDVPLAGSGPVDTSLVSAMARKSSEDFLAVDRTGAQLVVCEYRAIDSTPAGSCTYTVTTATRAEDRGQRFEVPRRRATFTYLVFEATTSRLVTRFDLRGIGCPPDQTLDFPTEPGPGNVAVDERDTEQVVARLMPVLTRPV